MGAEYLIDGAAFPYIPFDIGESYGGVLPISRPGNGTSSTRPAANTTEQQLYFWFFPSENPDATDEIMIWLNGGVSAPLASDHAASVLLKIPGARERQEALTCVDAARSLEYQRGFWGEWPHSLETGHSRASKESVGP